MRTVLMVTMLVAAAWPAGAQERLADRLRKGIVEEETAQNLDKAIQAYQAIVAQYDEERKTAGTALFRLAECYRKAGRREPAIAAYQRLVREFSDQATLVESSRKQLAATYGVADVRGVTPRPSPGDRDVQREDTARRLATERARASRDRTGGSVEETRIELEALQKKLADMRKRMEAGLVSRSEYEAQQTELLLMTERLRQQVTDRDARVRAEREDTALRQALIQSVQREIELLHQQIEAMEKRVAIGQLSPQEPELLKLRRELLGLQRKLEELKAGVRR